MALETASYISGLVTTNPVATDGISQADDHIRLIKSTIKATFPNINAAVTVTPAALNATSSLSSLAALSVFGNATNTAGTTGAITAGTDGHVLQRSGTTLAFGAVKASSIETIASQTFLGNVTGGAASPVALTVAQVTGALNASIAPVFANITSKPTTVAGYGITNGAVTNGVNTYTGAQRAGFTTLTMGSAYTPDLSAGNRFILSAAQNVNFTLNNPTNKGTAGQSWTLEVTQDATGGRTITYGTDYVGANGTKPTLSTAASASDLLMFETLSSGKILVTAVKAIA